MTATKPSAAPTEPGPHDLLLTRVLDAPRALVWKAWTDPEHLKKWFAPLPWTTPVCEMDLRPGGRFRTVMRGPDGTEHDGEGAFLEVVENERLVWTDALAGGYRPNAAPFMTAILTFEEREDGGTTYTALVLHKDAADRAKHEEMGFFEGWGTATDQLAAVARGLAEGGD